MGLFAMIPVLIVFAGLVFIIYYLPFLAKDSKKVLDSNEEIRKNLNTIVKQNDEIIKLLKQMHND